MKYDIFISYRRENGDQTAKAIYDRLKDQGYNVYLDVETLHSGAFNKKLYSVIDECRDVLVILSPNSLERCLNENDWVRLEVAHALKGKKNIIPVMLRGFNFPPELPADIDSLRYQNGIQAPAEFFDAFMEKLYRLLKSKPGIIRRFFTSLSWRRALIATGVSILLIAAIWGGSILIKQEILNKAVYPASQKEKNDVNNMLYYVQMNLTVADTMFVTYQNALKACEDYLRQPSGSSYQTLVSQLRYAREKLKKQSQQVMPLSPELSKTISQTKINLADLTIISQRPDLLLLDYDQTINFLEYVMNPQKPFDNATRYRIITINRSFLKYDAQSLLNGTCLLLLPIDENALKDFRTEFLPALSIISQELPIWSRDETGLMSQEKNIATQQDNLKAEYAALAGDISKDFLAEKAALNNLLKRTTVTPNPANTPEAALQSDLQSLVDKQKGLAEAQKKLEQLKQTAREKFAPNGADEPPLLWGKALRFLSLKMYDEAVSVFQ
ncbi:MAG: toll/interleukin-1 receptor domain-containing protein, partial [Firmicutes bacterium]|nr:toll/interleukin-1 receptor domain-containing protein [Bacillota bacterium]